MNSLSPSKLTKIFTKSYQYKIIYFPIRGRAEPIRLLFALNDIDWKESLVDKEVMKKAAGDDIYPFGQVPIVEEYDDVNMLHPRYLCQMDAILKRLGRRYGYYNCDEDEDLYEIDVLLSGIEAIRSAYTNYIYGELTPESKREYIQKHVDLGKFDANNGGAHFNYIEKLVERNKKDKNQQYFISSSKPTVADIQIFDICDLHIRIIGENSLNNYPHLRSIYQAFYSIPSISSYLLSDKRPKKANASTTN